MYTSEIRIRYEKISDQINLWYIMEKKMEKDVHCLQSFNAIVR